MEWQTTSPHLGLLVVLARGSVGGRLPTFWSASLTRQLLAFTLHSLPGGVATCAFHHRHRLRGSHITGIVSDSLLFADFLKFSSDKLFFIIRDQYLWDSETTNDRLPYKIYYFRLGSASNGLGFTYCMK